MSLPDGKSDVVLRHDSGAIEYRLMDGLNLAGYRIRPYEVQKGETDRVLEECKALLRETLRKRGSLITALLRCRSRLNRIEVDLSNASRQLRALEDQGLVARRVDPADRRVARFVVTAAGRRVLERVRAVALNDYAVALDDWSARDRRQLAALLDRFRESLLATEPDETGWSVGKSQ